MITYRKGLIVSLTFISLGLSSEQGGLCSDYVQVSPFSSWPYNILEPLLYPQVCFTIKMTGQHLKDPTALNMDMIVKCQLTTVSRGERFESEKTLGLSHFVTPGTGYCGFIQDDLTSTDKWGQQCAVNSTTRMKAVVKLINVDEPSFRLYYDFEEEQLKIGDSWGVAWKSRRNKNRNKEHAGIANRPIVQYNSFPSIRWQ